jgi:hypothetical protein
MHGSLGMVSGAAQIDAGLTVEGCKSARQPRGMRCRLDVVVDAENLSMTNNAALKAPRGEQALISLAFDRAVFSPLISRLRAGIDWPVMRLRSTAGRGPCRPRKHVLPKHFEGDEATGRANMAPSGAPHRRPDSAGRTISRGLVTT